MEQQLCVAEDASGGRKWPCSQKMIGLWVGSAIGIASLWMSTVAVFAHEYLIHADLKTVLIIQGCMGSSPASVFIWCFMQVCVASLLLRRYLAPLVFGEERYNGFDDLKQRKLIGFFAQIIVRASVAFVLVRYIIAKVSFYDGFLPNFNQKEMFKDTMEQHVAVTCGDSEFDPDDAKAFRNWMLAKYHMIAVHAWELAYIPDLTWDAWLHHIFVIFVGSLGSEPASLTGNWKAQPIVDAIGFTYIFGASLNSLVKLCVVMYHYMAPQALWQAWWMTLSIIGAVILTIGPYFCIPFALIIYHWKTLELKAGILFVLLTLILTGVEVRLIFVKSAIAINARKKARRGVAADAPPVDIVVTPVETQVSPPASGGLSFQRTSALSFAMTGDGRPGGSWQTGKLSAASFASSFKSNLGTFREMDAQELNEAEHLIGGG